MNVFASTRRCQSWQFVALLAYAAMTFPAYAAAPIVLIIGPPGSGRTTQAELLNKNLGIPIVAADDLIRRNPQKFPKNKIPGAALGVDPHLDNALNELVADVLNNADLSKGVVLDRYPASKAQADFLAVLQEKYNLPRPVVIHLSAPDNVIRKRLKKQNRPELEQQLKDYHREFDFVREYFPQSDIRTVDATKKPAKVAKEIRTLLEGGQNAGQESKP